MTDETDTRQSADGSVPEPLDTASGVFSYDWNGQRHASVAVVEAVAAATDSEPTLMPPLHRHVDADALDALLAGRNDTPLRVSFEYAGVTVTINHEGVIDVAIP